MPTLPSSLALTSILDGSVIIAADHRNNYAAIQTAENAVITCLSSGTTDQFLSTVGTTVAPAFTPGHEFAYTEITSTVNVVSTTEATPTTIVSANAVTFDGATAVWIEFFADQVVTPSLLASSVTLTLFEGASEITRMASLLTPAAAIMSVPVLAKRRITPSAGSHTYTIGAHASSTTGTPRVFAGNGSGAAESPAWIRITKA